MTRAPVALTCGDPSGIGPELAAKAWRALKEDLPFFLIGDPSHVPGRVPKTTILEPAETLRVCAGALPVLPLIFPAPARRGNPAPANAQSVIDAIARGVRLVKDGAASALCTLPIHKKAMKEGADFPYPGHTEYLAALCGIDRAVMMLAGPALRVVPATVHIALSEVAQALTPDLLEDTLRITRADLMRDFGLGNPRVAVAGLNPHAGEGGMMGAEDRTIIAPVIDRLRAEGWAITGPLPADTMFHEKARAQYDVAVCMYHDQALIPVKTLDFDRAVNVTLGLPVIRTSPDHGTAYDIAGTGKANPASLIEALRLAARMAEARG